MTDDERIRPGHIVAAASFAVLLVAASPLAGALRTSLRAAFPLRFVQGVGIAIGGSLAVAFAVAVWRIRSRRAVRYGALALSLAIGAIAATLLGSGSAEVDVVERVHFVEYGLLTLLFYRVWRPLQDRGVVWMPLVAGLLVATLDEWLQWFVPARVGELRDVLLDLVAVGCGLLFAFALAPPVCYVAALRPRSAAAVGRMGAIAVGVFALFFQSVHLGYEVDAPGIGVFRSVYSAEALTAAARDRTVRWSADPPVVFRRLSREDQYLSEGLWHVQRRNQAWNAGDVWTAWRENQILETYFNPVLDTSSYVSASSYRWPPEQRADAGRRAGRYVVAEREPYQSTAEPYPIFAWPRSLFWAIILASVGALLAWSEVAARRRSSAAGAA